MPRSRTNSPLPRLEPVDRPAAEPPQQPGKDASDVTDALVARARDGDVGAWARLYQDHFDLLFSDVGYLVCDAAVAEDVVQETFARALASLHRFGGRSSFSTWLRGIATNVVRKHWRTRSRRRRAYAQLEALSATAPKADTGSPEATHIRRRKGDVLLAVLDTLPAHLREAFVLCDLREMATTEAAELLGISTGNLRVRASRARARIRRELSQLGWLKPEDGDS